jgi:hypothetical protein
LNRNQTALATEADDTSVIIKLEAVENNHSYEEKKNNAIFFQENEDKLA